MTDHELIDKAKCLRDRMLTIIKTYTGNCTEAEDIVQDAMLKLWTKRKALDGAKIETFSSVVARHLAIDHLRSLSARQQHSVSIDDIAAMQIANEQEPSADIEQRSQLLLKAVKHLPSQQQILLRLRYFNGKDIDSIAQITGSSTDNVYKSLSRARLTLYRMLAVMTVLVCIVCLPFVLSTEKTAEVAQVTTPTISQDADTSHTQIHAVASETSLCTQSTTSTQHVVKTTKPKTTPQPILKQQMVIYSDAENDDIQIVATMSYKKNDTGDYHVLSCNYEPVSESGRKAFFVPDEKIKCNINASMVNIDINGTLTYEDANGQSVEKYVSVNQVVFK